MFNQFLPNKAQQFIHSAFQYYLNLQFSSSVTLLIEETNGLTRNELFEASEVYLLTKITSTTAEKLKVSKGSKDQNLTTKFAECEQIFDSFGGMELKWRFNCQDSHKNWKSEDDRASERQWFELSFHKENRDKVLESYLPHILAKAEAIKKEKKVVKLYTLAQCSTYGVAKWEGINFQHPSNFNTLAMEPDMKQVIIEDLDRFVRRKEFYKKVGKAWKRGYLLYGPPGTGKSSLIAAIANYLKFDVYDLQLSDLNSDSYLRKVLLATSNRSILVIEDIDCSVDFTNSKQFQCVSGGSNSCEVQLTLSSLLNFIDGLWSSCGDERIIIFTTNHKDRLNPALLRPGRMDMHIHMSYCTIQGFRLLASNYLGINNHNELFSQIEGLMKTIEVTPAEVAEELMKSEDADFALSGLVNLLKRKRMEANSPDTKVEKSSGIDAVEAKRMKLDDVMRNSGTKINGRRVVRGQRR